MTIDAMRAALPSVSPDELLRLLVQAKEAEIANIVSGLPPQERARVAFFCYARGHLHDIGIAVAATCDLPFLMQAAPSNAAGHRLFARSRARVATSIEPTARRRPAITLAKSALSSDEFARIIASIADDDVEPIAEAGLAPAVC
jgi:hypothetical protein